MAWSFDGLAKADFDTNTALHNDRPVVICNSFPFLVKKIRVVADSTTAAEVLHGETNYPAVVLVNGAVTNPSVDGTIAAYQGSTKAYVKFDVGAAATFDAYLIWFEQATGGIS
jgi:hypothetical protein